MMVMDGGVGYDGNSNDINGNKGQQQLMTKATDSNNQGWQ